MKKKLIIIFSILVVVILAIILIYEKPSGNVIGEKRLAELSSDDRVVSPVEELNNLISSSYLEDDAVGYFIKMGFSWKSIADITKDEQDYQYAIEAYRQAENSTTQGNILPINNIGVIYELLGKYDLAEQEYLKALAISPVEYDTNKKLFDLYRYKLDKDSVEIIALLDKALATAVERAPLLQLKAGYLKDLGDYQGALDIYKNLVEDYPQFQVVIDELEDKIK